MSHIIHIETSTKNCSIAIGHEGKLVALTEESDQNYQHAEKLHQFIDWAMEGAEKEYEQIDAVCVSKGPGSYTGLRIGVSAAKGLCFALGIPLLAIDSLSILANSVQKEYDLIIPMLDARRKEVYTATYNAKKEMISPIEAKILDENSFLGLKDKRVLFLGDGAEKAQEILQLPKAEFSLTLPSAEHMVAQAYQLLKEDKTEDVAYFEPFYLKEFIAGK